MFLHTTYLNSFFIQCTILKKKINKNNNIDCSSVNAFQKREIGLMWGWSLLV